MAEATLETLLDLLEKEAASKSLSEIPRSAYLDAASRVKGLRSNSGSDEIGVQARLANRERELLGRAAKLLLDTRIKKVWAAQNGEHDSEDLSKLTPEERYVVEPLMLFFRRLKAFETALAEGQTAVLTRASRMAASSYIVVRYLNHSPATVGSDLSRYGPFRREDVAVLPAENALQLIRQGLAREVWADEK